MDNENSFLDESTFDEAVFRSIFSELLLIDDFPEFNQSSPLTVLESNEFVDLISDVVRPFEQRESSTSKTSPKYTPIQIFIGDDQEIDLEQPSTSSSIVSSQPELPQDSKVYTRIRELREAGLWDSTRLPKCEDPPRKKTHWDFFLEEVLWLANDFKAERKFKRRWAKQFALNAKAHWRKITEFKTEPAAFTRDEKEAKRVCSSIARMIREFWQNVDKIVDFRANEIVECKKRKALDQHLNFLVGAADKITSIIQERLVDSPTSTPSRKDLNGIDYDDADISEDDGESTIDQEEAERSEAHIDQELDELYKEKDMDIDQLLTSLPAGYLDYLGYKSTDLDATKVSEDMDETESKTTIAAEITEDTFNDKPDLRNVDYAKLTSNDSEIRRQQLDNIAEAALEFQPRGHTLETAEVKTDIPFLLRGQLREYQLVGLDWLVTLYEKNLNGILADEMGLGKTIQTIALLAHLACARAIWGPHLIIVPTSVILNWEMELKKWCPSLKVLTYFGTAKERAEKRKGWSKQNAFHVCITSYKLATQDIRAFKKRAWQYLILDEAQNIKNFKSQRWQLLLGLRSRRRLLLTGTPLQNSLMELWALLHFLMPNVFASHNDFKEWFHSPITGMVEGTSEVDQALIQRLHKVLRPFILRRLKSEVEKQLPTKTEKIVPCPLSKRQRFLYNEFLSKRSTKENLRSGSMLSVLGVIMQLRKCCNHPNLFEPRPVISPLLTPSIFFQIPSSCFSIRSENAKPSYFIPDITSSELTWQTFVELSSPENLQCNLQLNKEGEFLPFIDGIKFVNNGGEGHFFKPQKMQSNRDGDHLCNGEYHHTQFTTEFVNNTRKRRMPSPANSDGGKNNTLEIFHDAQSKLQTALKMRNADILQIMIRRNAMARFCVAPILSKETVSFINTTADEHIYKVQQPLFCAGNDNNMTLFDRVNEQIARNILDWLETSLSRFLLCVRTLLIASPFEYPFSTSFSEKSNSLLFMQIHSAQNSLAHKAEICSKLEFPELRLIEYDCGKLQLLAKLLEQLYENRHRCLIFTQMSRMLDILQAFLSYHNYKYFRLDGATHIDQRQAMMERFNADDSIFCFILSTRSGGIGVNLTGADTVIFYDSDWNPTMDAQAQDRCHRIGQTRNVTIYRLISERTIEENILTKSMQKRRLGEMAIDEGEFTPAFFKSTNTLRELFSNEETIADIIAPVLNQPQNTKDIEMAMQSVEDTQDVIAARVAKEETRADSAEFDENIAAEGVSEFSAESPSDQYMELISGLKPVERYAVNFLANEYRPALDKEFEETEAFLKAKQKEFLEGQESTSDTDAEQSEREQEGADALDITYDVDTANELALFTSIEVPFDEIPSWMPPSPPNSAAGKSPNYYQSMEGILLYEPVLMSEEKLPPLPPMVSLSEVPPRIRPRPRKMVNIPALLSARTSSPAVHRRRRTPSGAAAKLQGGRGPREKGHQARAEKKEQRPPAVELLPTVVVASPNLPPALLSPPSTPMAVMAEQQSAVMAIGFGMQVQTREERATTLPGQHVQSSTAPLLGRGPTASLMMMSSLDESIESTVRKSRKPPVSHGPSTSTLRHIVRNTGLPPQRTAEERLVAEPSRISYKLVWPTGVPTAAIQQPCQEPLDYEGPAWTANEDQRLLKAICAKHGLSTELLARPAIQLNWDFVAQYVNMDSSHFRSARQCALRYQSFVVHCDESLTERTAPSNSRRQRAAVGAPVPHSVVLDSNFCTQDATIETRRRATQMETAQQRRRGAAAELLPNPAQQQQPQLLCLTGRLPSQQEQRLLELGARYTNVRPVDILQIRRDRLMMRRQGEPQQPPTTMTTTTTG